MEHFCRPVKRTRALEKDSAVLNERVAAQSAPSGARLERRGAAQDERVAAHELIARARLRAGGLLGRLARGLRRALRLYALQLRQQLRLLVLRASEQSLKPGWCTLLCTWLRSALLYAL